MPSQCCSSSNDEADYKELVHLRGPISGREDVDLIIQKLTNIAASQLRLEQGHLRIERLLQLGTTGEYKVDLDASMASGSAVSAMQPSSVLLDLDDPLDFTDPKVRPVHLPTVRSGRDFVHDAHLPPRQTSQLQSSELQSSKTCVRYSDSSYAEEPCLYDNVESNSLISSRKRTESSLLDSRLVDMSKEPGRIGGGSGMSGGHILPAMWPASVLLRSDYSTQTGTEILDFLQHIGNVRPINAFDSLCKSTPSASNSRLAPEGCRTITIDSCLDATIRPDSLSCPSLARSSLPRETLWCGNRFIIDPASASRMSLDVASLLCLAFDMFAIPFVLAWDVDAKNGSWLSITFWVVCIFWTLDILFNFRTGYYNSKDGDLELRGYKIARHYLKTWFLMDLSIVLSDWLCLLLPIFARQVANVETVKILRLVKTSRLARLLGIMRVAKIKGFVERMCRTTFTENHEMFMQIPLLLLVVVWINHMVACTWYAIGKLSVSDTGLHWLDCSMAPDTSMRADTYASAGAPYQYSTALHWALTQMTPGSMQIHALNTYERFCNAVCLILGMLFFGSLISLITSKATQLNMNREKKRSAMTTLRRFLSQEEGISKQTRLAVLKQVANRMARAKHLTISDVPSLSLLSTSLRIELQYQIYKPIITYRNVFLYVVDSISSHVMQMLCNDAVKHFVLSNGDNLFMAGADAEAAFLVRYGRLRYRQEPGVSKVSKTTDERVEPGKWLCEVALWTKWMHVGTVEDLSGSEILAINAATLSDCLRRHGVLWQIAQEHARAFHKKIIRCHLEGGFFPSDIKRPFQNYNELLIALPAHAKKFIGLLTLYLLQQTQWPVISRKVIASLEEQVMVGSCTLGLDEDNQVVRVVAVTALRLSDINGKIFAQLARVENGQISVRCRLPGCKQKDDETPDRALQSLISGKLHTLAEDIEIVSSSTHTHNKSSQSYLVHTSYLRTVFKAFYTKDSMGFSSQPIDHVDSGRSSGHSGRTQAPTESSTKAIDHSNMVFTRSGENNEYTDVGAWIPESDFDFFSTPAGSKKLEHLLAEVPEMAQCRVQRQNRSAGMARPSLFIAASHRVSTWMTPSADTQDE